jgi:hypothetical protein
MEHSFIGMTKEPMAQAHRLHATVNGHQILAAAYPISQASAIGLSTDVDQVPRITFSVGSFFARRGEKRTYKRRKEPLNYGRATL